MNINLDGMDNNQNTLQQRTQKRSGREMLKVGDKETSPHSMSTMESTQTLKNIHERIQKLRKDLINQVDEQLKDVVSDIIENINHYENDKDWSNSEKKSHEDKKKSVECYKSSEKHYKVRNSMLVDMYKESNHIGTIYNLCVAILVIVIVNVAVEEYFATGSIKFHSELVGIGFSKIFNVIYIWFWMIMGTIGIYLTYAFWASKRIGMKSKPFKHKIWDYGSILCYVLYQLLFFIIPLKMALAEKFPPPCLCIILMEQLRFVMKVHAFIRSTAPSIIQYKSEKKNSSPVPEFSKFLYFMFAPTLIYRDSYPRTKMIRWRSVAWYFFEFYLTINCLGFVFEHYVISVYKDYGIEPFNNQKFILRYFNTIVPGLIIFFLGFYCLLHAWMNAFAELLCFGDRLFYKDWWNSTNYGMYFRKWNLVVHDWLYIYIYKDIYEIVVPGNKFVAKFVVFFVSAIFHEYAIGFTLNLFCPIMLVLFGGIGYSAVFLTYIKNSSFGNVLFWFSLAMGLGLSICLYSMAYFAANNCPRNYDNIYDIFVPALITCYM